MARRLSFLFLVVALAAVAASSVAASRQPTPTPTSGPTPTPEPRKGESLMQQQQQPLPTTTTTASSSSSNSGGSGSGSSCRPEKKATSLPHLPFFASAPEWQRRLRSPTLKVLAVPLVSGRSHLFVMHAVAAELAARGHEVKVR